MILQSIGRRGDDVFRSFIVEILEICKFVLMSEYFYDSLLRSSLSNRGAKLKNEFAATENQWTDGGPSREGNFSKNLHRCCNSKTDCCLDKSFISSAVYIFRPCREPIAGARDNSCDS